MVFFRAHRFALAGAPRTRGKRHRKRQARRLRAGWTIQEIVFCVESALYDWLDRLSLAAAPKWHTCGFSFSGPSAPPNLAEKAPPAGTAALVSPHGSAIKAEVLARYETRAPATWQLMGE